ncbi:MAG: hypothetical protein IJ764_02380 [Bacteroidales bacterium]|nr:hypothetical protein [Bacteroidales bacterium]
MKRFCLFIALCLSVLSVTAQQWSDAEIAAANTAKDISQLSVEERETIKYLNLARLYPRKFADLEVADYYGGDRMGQPSRVSDDRLTLIAELYQMEPRPALVFSPRLLPEARCLADEQSRNGEVGHTRHKCSKTYGGECCGYGFEQGREIALQLLIDDGIEGLGHRANCLNGGFASVAVSIASHPQFNYGAVLDFDWGNPSDSTILRYVHLADLAPDDQARFYALMTRRVDPVLLDPKPSGSTMTHAETTAQTTTSSTGTTTVVKTETRYHADGSRQIITTTTVIGLDGSSSTQRTSTVER